jgi:hypothetical protein
MVKEFNIDWNISEVGILSSSKVYQLENAINGIYYITQEASLLYPKEEKEYYKYTSIIYENSLAKKSIFICIDSEKAECLSIQNIKYTVVEWNEVLNMFPKTLKEKQDRILCNLSNINSIYGANIEGFNADTFFSKDKTEMVYLVELMNTKGLIYVHISKTIGVVLIETGLKILENGWDIIEKVNNPVNKNSKQVFIAMWFDKSMDSAFEKMYKAVKELGFNPLRIDTKEHNNEISGEILYEIGKSRFIIADVTGQRAGVYFEAGYAIGNKIPVIWTCKNCDMANIHFDTRQYNHIIWSDEEDLYEKIGKRIKGTILIE